MKVCDVLGPEVRCEATVEVECGEWSEGPEILQCDLQAGHTPRRHHAEDAGIPGGRGRENVVLAVEWDTSE